MRMSLSFSSSSLHGLAGEPRDVLHEALARVLSLLDPAQAVLPVAGQIGRGEGVAVEQAHHVEALLGGHQRATVALDVADGDQPLDDRRARRGGADSRVLHRLAQLVVVDELAGGLHRAQQRGVAVAARRLGFLAGALDLARLHVLAFDQPRQLLIGRLVLLGLGLRLRGDLAVDAAPAGHHQQLAARAEDVLLHGGLHARVLEHRLGVEDRQEAPHRPCRRCACRRRPSDRRCARRGSG